MYLFVVRYVVLLLAPFRNIREVLISHTERFRLRLFQLLGAASGAMVGSRGLESRLVELP